MKPLRRAVLAAIPLLAFSDSAAFASAGPLKLEEFFRGKTVGKGVFESRIAGVKREFTVITTGTWNPKTFTLRLREDFRYADGERDTKVWFFQKVAEDRYIGQRSDVFSPTNVRTVGNDLKFSYAAEVETRDGTIALRFNDTLTRVEPGVVRNTARVVKYGLTIGTVDLTFRKSR
ncbi:DUF3833 family protein [Rhizobiales bacterium]|uniref:DUF3833 family protein n=1 Tax=Hongsoonwoonella zoysiae TaxID=2821844 RepID=UPI0015616E9C|nr:DUF3833 family protein [Hongsoonwoonella zoysiae]NRG19432.1 DUF3833 family protein [Hongsoonwoonella zoysiae]